jgi:chemotaxis signal transduction protein
MRMSSASTYLLLHLRQQFDSSFEQAPAPLANYEDVLFVHANHRLYALLVREIKGLAKIDRLTPLPSAAEGFAGLVGTRGEVVPVFDLGILLGLGPSVRKLEWMVRVEAPECAVGLAFEDIEGYSRTPAIYIEDPQTAGPIMRTVELRGQHAGLIGIERLLKKICTENGEADGQ